MSGLFLPIFQGSSALVIRDFACQHHKNGHACVRGFHPEKWHTLLSTWEPSAQGVSGST